MSPTPVNLHQKLALIHNHWSPRIVAQMNDYHFKLVKVQGDFVWHSHPETDETFIVLLGRLTIELRAGRLDLNPGEMVVLPRGVEHRPVAAAECHLLLVEPAGTVNTGDAGGDLTAAHPAWI